MKYIIFIISVWFLTGVLGAYSYKFRKIIYKTIKKINYDI